MRPTMPAALPGAAPCAGWVAVLRFVGAAVVWLGRAVAFALALVVELVTAWLGIAPVAPRVRWWRGRLAAQWRAERAGVVEAELVEGVWR